MRKEESRFVSNGVFEGIISIRALIDGARLGTTDRKIERVLYDPERYADARKRPELMWLKKTGERLGFEVAECRREEIDELATGSSHGGLLAIAGERTFGATDPVPGGFYMLLEGIEDPYNFGYALRSIYAAGANGVVMTPRNWMSAAGVVCRASAGASELMPLSVAEPEEAVRIFRERGYKIVCADLREAVCAFDADLSRPLLVIVGGERRGISRALLELADLRVLLPYGREFSASLSAASAASIIAYEVLRQNR
ncbi:MAG TPA: RNA methyltransferase [Bacillota bacterium]|nr:RNA methyltransferase [Bacillota bacterium]